jgi:hypothetical protein
VVEEPAHAAAAAMVAFMAVEAERVAAVVAMTAFGMTMTFKHVGQILFRYIETTDISKSVRIKSDFRYI